MCKLSRKHNWLSGSPLCMACLILFTFDVSADTLQLSIPLSVSNNLPQLTQRIIHTLHSTGYKIEIQNIPNKRSFNLLNQGKIAIEILRNPKVAEEFPDLIVINPPVLHLDFLMVTSAKTPEYCSVSEDEYSNMSVAGVLGIGIHKHHYYPKFGSSTELSDTSSTLKFVSLQRANVTFLPSPSIALLPEDIKSALHICQTHKSSFKFNTHIHKKYKWAKDKIEAAYRKEFGVNQE